jgi:ABC-type uncharacterized transport system substrate-binding protein
MSRIQRRHILLASGAMLAAWLARAQAPKAGHPRRIGVLGLSFEPKIPAAQRAGVIALRKLGWIEGENLIVERAYAELRIERLTALAEGLLRKRVEVVWTDGSQSALAAARATQTVPIAFSNAVWPLETGLIDSFARPGRNLTGTSIFAETGTSTKRLEFLREIVPTAKRLSRLSQPDLTETLAGGTFDMGAVWDAAAERLGFVGRAHAIRKEGDIDAAFAEIAAWPAQAINASGGDYTFGVRQRIAEFALSNRMPSVFSSRSFVEAGGLLSYAPLPAEGMTLLVRSFEYVDRILRGARPSELPVERPSRFELVINMKTAKALGLKIPQTLLARADRVIE